MNTQQNVRFAHRVIGDGRVTIAFVEDESPNNDIVWIGASWMSPKEKHWHRKRGNQIALGRATCTREPTSGVGGRICLGLVPDGVARVNHAMARLIVCKRAPGWVVDELQSVMGIEFIYTDPFTAPVICVHLECEAFAGAEP